MHETKLCGFLKDGSRRNRKTKDVEARVSTVCVRTGRPVWLQQRDNGGEGRQGWGPGPEVPSQIRPSKITAMPLFMFSILVIYVSCFFVLFLEFCIPSFAHIHPLPELSSDIPLPHPPNLCPFFFFSPTKSSLCYPYIHGCAASHQDLVDPPVATLRAN